MLRLSFLKSNRAIRPCSLHLASCFFLALCSLFLYPFNAQSQIKYEVEAQAIGTTNGVVPFWMRSNQYGSIPMAGASSSFLAGGKREYNLNKDSLSGKTKLMDWGLGFEGRTNINMHTTQFILTEAYLKGRLGPFEVKVGRNKETMGLTGDSLFTSGSFSMSGNALGIPKVEVSITEYYNLPILNEIFAVKGNFTHGWMGMVPLQSSFSKTIPLVLQVPAYLHQKSLYGRIGRANWKLKLFGGINHQVVWGNERQYYGNKFKLNNLQSFKYVFLGYAYGDGIERSKVGNHLGSIDLGFEYSLRKHRLFFYRQNVYDVGALASMANIMDGLNGISILNLSKKRTKISRLTFELFYSKNQAGELWSKITKSGDENYYNNYIYKEGWTYKGLGIGNPLITPKWAARNGLVSDPRDYFINNRVLAIHSATEVVIKRNITLNSRITYTQNYGTYKTTIGESMGIYRIPPRYGIFKPINQLSGSVKLSRLVGGNTHLGLSFVGDYGQLLHNSYGAIAQVSHSF